VSEWDADDDDDLYWIFIFACRIVLMTVGYSREF
jgi:hypothetical protein